MSRVSAAVSAAAFAVLAVLVSAGRLTSLDQWAVEHAMPGATFTTKSPTLASALIPLRHVRWHGTVHVLAELVTLPAAFTPATAVVALALLRRGPGTWALAGAYVVGNLVEVVTKAVLTRPALHVHGMHLAGFDASYPSGHTLRTIFVAVVVAWAWPRLTPVACAWALSSIALIELGGQHVPSDIAGGSLLAATLLATTWSSWSVAWWTGRRPSPACPPSVPAR